MLPPPDFKPGELFKPGKPRLYQHPEYRVYGTYFYYDGKSDYLISNLRRRIKIGSAISTNLHPLSYEETTQEISYLERMTNFLKRKKDLIEKKNLKRK